MSYGLSPEFGACIRVGEVSNEPSEVCKRRQDGPCCSGPHAPPPLSSDAPRAQSTSGWRQVAGGLELLMPTRGRKPKSTSAVLGQAARHPAKDVRYTWLVPIQSWRLGDRRCSAEGHICIGGKRASSCATSSELLERMLHSDNGMQPRSAAGEAGPGCPIVPASSSLRGGQPPRPATCKRSAPRQPRYSPHSQSPSLSEYPLRFHALTQHTTLAACPVAPQPPHLAPAFPSLVSSGRAGGRAHARQVGLEPKQRRRHNA